MNYVPGDVLVFQQNAKGYSKGQRVFFGNEKLPFDQAARFQTYHASTMAIAPGDVLRVTQNGKTACGRHRLNNGSSFTVKKFDSSGNIVLANGWTIGKDFGHLAYGFVVTSHAAQGKTVDRVFIRQSSHSFPATSREQFYVSVSRARKQATVYTNDKEMLLEAVRRTDERQSATELVAERNYRERGISQQRLERLAEMSHNSSRNEFLREELIHER